MHKRFEIAPRRDAWDVRHNKVSFRICQRKREAIRLALTLGRLQLRMGDDAEIVLLDDAGAQCARHEISAQPAPRVA
jgi:hypothetical protein